MTSELEESIKQTQATLGAIFAKPKCTSKLLSKPPFRFIHDIITATIKTVGFPKNYFSPKELNSKAFKDKAEKIAFLENFIYLVGVCHGSPILVSPSKIVAGLEPIKTNFLLTSFGSFAIDQSIDHDAIVRFCKEGGEIGDFEGRIIAPTVAAESKTAERSETDQSKMKQSKQNLDVDVEGNTTSNSNEQMQDSKSKDDKFESQKLSHINGDKDGKDTDVDQDKTPSNQHELIERCDSDPKRTKEMMTRIVSKPKCSEKLLKKPPFRFLHDLIMAVNKSASMNLEDIFSEDEMDSSKVKEKEAKIRFLEKILSHVSTKLNISIDVKPSKIVAGLEGDKTCHFLQLLAVVATADIENKDRKTDMGKGVGMSGASLKNEGEGTNDQDTIHNTLPERGIQGIAEKGLPLEHDEKDKEKITDMKESDQYNPPEPEEGKLGDVEIDSPFVTLQERDIEQHNNDQDAKKEQIDSSHLLDSQRGQTVEKDAIRGNVTFTSSAFFEDSGNIHESHDDGNDLLQGEVREERNALKSARPQTARRRPPRLRVNKSLSARKFQSSPPVETVKKPFVFGDDNEVLPVEQISGCHDAMMSLGTHSGKTGDVERRTNNEEEKSMDKEISTEKTPIRIHTKLKKRREIFVSSSQYGATPYNIEAITSSIQKIARSAAPIGQVMNYLPSDLAKMNKERDHWKLLFTKRRKAFNEAKEVTETELSPLQHQIQVVDEEIEQVKRMIATAKKKIILNDEWIKDRLQKFMRAYAIRQ